MYTTVFIRVFWTLQALGVPHFLSLSEHIVAYMINCTYAAGKVKYVSFHISERLGSDDGRESEHEWKKPRRYDYLSSHKEQYGRCDSKQSLKPSISFEESNKHFQIPIQLQKSSEISFVFHVLFALWSKNIKSKAKNVNRGKTRQR